MNRYEEITDAISSLYGRPRWSGAQARVWPVGDIVLKLLHIDGSEISDFFAMRWRQMPVAEVLSVQVDAEDAGIPMYPDMRILLIIQKRVRDHKREQFNIAPRTELDGVMPPRIWTDETGQAWQQFDSHMGNAVGGVWVDIGSITRVHLGKGGKGHG